MPLGLPSTFSIVAADAAAGEVGVAVQSKYFAVGSVVPWAQAGVGAVATQAAGVAVYGRRVLELLEQGVEPQAALERTLAADADRETRQLGVVTADGRAAAFTGADCLPWAGHEAGEGYAVQGNLLAGEEVVRELARAFRDASGSLAERLQAALAAGQAAGGDRRGQQSAALLVERVGAAAEGREGVDKVVDLRVDDHAAPIDELGRLLQIQLRWDVLRRASGHYAARRWAEGAELLRAGLDRFGDDPVLLYDLACYEALGGDAEGALRHLRRAVALDPGLAEAAAVDDDLAAVRSRV